MQLVLIVYTAEGEFDRLYSNLVEASERASHIGGSVQTWGVVPTPGGTQTKVEKEPDMNGGEKKAVPDKPTPQVHPQRPGRPQ